MTEAATSLLEAPTTTTTGADAPDTSLLDAPADGAKDGQDGKTPAASPTNDTPAKTGDDATPKPDDKAADGTKPPAVPEKYADFKTPEGVALDAEVVAKFDAECKALGLPQEKRDALLNLQVTHTQTEIQKTMDAFQKQITDWADETKKELGPDAEKVRVMAAKAIDRIFTDPAENKAFRSMMAETGMGNWKLMVKAFRYVGERISEDRLVEGNPDSKPRKSNEEVLFDHPTSKASMQFQ